MRRFVRLTMVVVILLPVGFYALHRPPQAPDPAIVSLLQCEECSAGELDSVVALGGAAVPTLERLLLTGPSQQSRQLMESYLRERYREYVAYITADPRVPLTMTEQDYVAEYAGNHVARVRRRSALALGGIGGPDATSALCDALRLNLRRDVRATILEVIDNPNAC